jgi:hypothetical protein
MDTTRSVRALAALLPLTFFAACATMPRQREDATLYPWQTSRALITAQQLRSADATSFVDALRRLRPLLFSQPAPFAVSDPYRGYPVLYVDGRLQGGLDLLSTIPLSIVRSVQVLTGVEGHAYFGRYHPGGVVEVNINR